MPARRTPTAVILSLAPSGSLWPWDPFGSLWSSLPPLLLFKSSRGEPGRRVLAPEHHVPPLPLLISLVHSSLTLVHNLVVSLAINPLLLHLRRLLLCTSLFDLIAGDAVWSSPEGYVCGTTSSSLQPSHRVTLAGLLGLETHRRRAQRYLASILHPHWEQALPLWRGRTAR